MYTDELVTFLEELRANNDKAWFDANRSRYTPLRERFVEITAEILAATAPFDSALEGVDASKCIFRINRDVRFTTDKSPYKTSFAAVLMPNRKGHPHGYYYCIDAEGSLEIGAGIHLPAAPLLRKIRQAIARDGAALERILCDPRVRNIFGELDGEQLKATPRDFPADHTYIRYIKFKSFTLGHIEPAANIADTALPTHVADLFAAASPFVKYLRRILG